MLNFPKEFFDEETRDGFTISPMMKRAWAAELEILEAVLNVCDKHHLRCFADGGTLLGAVRHQGYIPWDDDIDMAMLRDEYDELIRHLPSELPEGIVISGMHADSPRLQQAGNVAHLRVIADEDYWNLTSYMTRFHGFPFFRIGIDIFPLDYLSKDQDVIQLQFQLCHMIMFTIQNWELYIKEGILEDQLKEIERASDVKLDRSKDLTHQLWLLNDRISSITPPADSSEVTNIQYTCHFPVPFHDRPLEDYADVVYLPFEHIKLPAPIGYDDALRRMYGNYMTPVRWTASHEYPFYQKQEAALQEIFDNEGMNISIEDFCHNWQAALGEI